MTFRLFPLMLTLGFSLVMGLSPSTQAQPASRPAAPAAKPKAEAAKPAVQPKAQVKPAFVAPEVQFIEITIKSAKVWPIKPSGRCWDPPCFFQKFKNKLPPRDSKFEIYSQHKVYKKLCKRPIAPDPLVEIKIGNYEIFTTDKVNNQCNPVMNFKHTFRVMKNDPFTVSVYDNDGAAKVQVKRDHMGTWSQETVPLALRQGKILKLGRFGMVQELVLSARVIKRNISKGCDGVYKVRIAEYSVKEQKESGKTWDRGMGKATRPDVFVELTIGNTVLKSPTQDNTFLANFYNVSGVFTVKKGNSVSLKVFDKDISLFGKSQEKIGETAFTDVCSLIGPDGMFTSKPFGQVEKVVLIFEKQN